MSIEERLAAAERRIAELERRLGSEPITQQPVVTPWQQPWATPVPVVWPRNGTCNCPPNTICGNVACPRRIQVTCVTSSVAGPVASRDTRLQQ